MSIGEDMQPGSYAHNINNIPGSPTICFSLISGCIKHVHSSLD